MGPGPGSNIEVLGEELCAPLPPLRYNAAMFANPISNTLKLGPPLSTSPSASYSLRTDNPPMHTKSVGTVASGSPTPSGHLQPRMPRTQEKTQPIYRGTMSTIKPKKRFLWSDMLHQEFIAGVFDIGLKAVHEDMLMHMLMLDESYRKTVLAQLQRFRHFRYQCRALLTMNDVENMQYQAGTSDGGPEKPKVKKDSSEKPSLKRKRVPDDHPKVTLEDLSNPAVLNKQLATIKGTQNEAQYSKIMSEILLSQNSFQKNLQGALRTTQTLQASILNKLFFEREAQASTEQMSRDPKPEPDTNLNPPRVILEAQPTGKAQEDNETTGTANRMKLGFGAAARAKDAFIRTNLPMALPNDLKELRNDFPFGGSLGSLIPSAISNASWNCSEELMTLEMESQMNMHRQMMIQKMDQVSKYEEKKDPSNGTGCRSQNPSTSQENLEWLLEDETLDEQLFDFLMAEGHGANSKSSTSR